MISKLRSIFTETANTFEGQEEGEVVHLLLRRHPFIAIIQVIVFLLLAMIPPLLLLFFNNFLFKHQLLTIFFFVSSVWYLIIWSGIFYSLTMYTLDVWIVTDRRIIDSKQHGFFSRQVAELHMNRVQDITVQTRGLIPTILKYGDLQVQSAGADERFFFLQVPHPLKVKDTIMKLVADAPAR